MLAASVDTVHEIASALFAGEFCVYVECSFGIECVFTVD
jgi:hypothetical protein